MLAPPAPRLEKVDQVLLQLKDRSSCHRGSLLLTSHHVVFHCASSTRTQGPASYQIPLSLIAQATRLPSFRTISANGPGARIYPIAFHQKDFDSCVLGFATEAAQSDVFESIKHCAVLTDTLQLFAFYYQPQPSSPSLPRRGDGWTVYDVKSEFTRQGLGSRTKAWRLTDVNAQYQFCPSYPALMAVPSRISDATLGYASKYRSKARIPALTYLHWANQGSITRSSQPMVGLKNARSIQDEKLIEAIFTSHHFADPDSMAAKAAAEATSNAPSGGGVSTLAVYGATSTNLIIDARPTTNAMANVARGAGTENMEYYKGCKKTYLGIDNIHVMRDSLNRLTEALRESEPAATFGTSMEALRQENGLEAQAPTASGAEASTSTVRLPPSSIDPHALRRSNWLKHITGLLEGTMTITRNVHINSSHVLIHCSDGWDRTSQLAALAEICLDPYFRTFTGFAVLIEKDWLSFGHRFGERGGFKGNEKFFVTSSRQTRALDDDERGSDHSDTEAEPRAAASAASGGFDGQAAANAFWGFTKQLTANFSAATSSHPPGPHRGSHIKETSPVFHQFLDCVWQIMRQFPQRFEFSAAYLVEVLRVSQECKYGTFLMDCERERLQPRDEDGRALPALPTRTVSAWDYLLSEPVRQTCSNPAFAPDLDDRDGKRSSTDMGVLFVDPREVRYFERLFKREDNQMNAALDKEADERRRARERLERAVRGENPAAAAAAAAASAKLDPADETSATIAVVEAGDRDPVLDAAGLKGIGAAVSQAIAPGPSTRGGSSSPSEPLSTSTSFGPGSTGNPPGAVDISKPKVDPSNLGYQVRKARTAGSRSALSPSASSSGLGSSGAGATSPGSAAGDAAHRMKSLLIGGWGRLQDAVGGTTPELGHEAVSRSGGSHPSQTTAQRVDDPWRRADSSGEDPPSEAGPGQWPEPATPLAAEAGNASAHNPWAANTDWKREMQMDRDRIAGRGSVGMSAATEEGVWDREASGTKDGKVALDPLGVL